jgi:hypothetical protein
MATQPTIREQEPRKFEPRSINFPNEVQDTIAKWIDKNIESLKKRLENLHKHKVPQRRAVIDGKPKAENKSWPFPNCSNLVAQLAGEAVDEIVAWVIQLIWISQPLVYFRYPEEKDPEQAKKNSDKEKALATFIDDEAFDPDGLNLYHYHNKWFTDAAGLGKARICVAPETRLEAVWTGYDPQGGSKQKGADTFDEKIIREGPKLINIRYEDILCDPDVEVFEENDPLFRRCVMSQRKIRERVFKGHFKEAEAKKVLEHPDRYGPDEIRRREDQKKGITDASDMTMAEWDIYEGYFSWYHNRIKFRLICWYHPKSKSMLNCVYNFMPGNKIPIVETRLSVDGKGAAEIMKDAQEEVSTAKNNRNDAILYGMLGINTIDRQNKELDRNFTNTPGIFLPAKAGTFQHYDMANPAMAGLSLQNEEAMIMQAKQRFGIDPAIAGAGAGSMGKNKQFGSMGTLAVLQASNSRSSHRTSSFRHSKVRLDSLITDMYGLMGLGNTELVKEALLDYISRKLKIPVRAADASMNKEVTKQNEIILMQAYDAFVKSTSSLIQAYQNQGSGDAAYKKWLRAIIIGKIRMFQQVLKDFQLTDNPQEFCPDIELAQPQESQQNAQKPDGGGPIPVNALAQIFQRRGGSPGGAPGGGAPGAPGGLPGQGGGPFVPSGS